MEKIDGMEWIREDRENCDHEPRSRIVYKPMIAVSSQGIVLVMALTSRRTLLIEHTSHIVSQLWVLMVCTESLYKQRIPMLVTKNDKS